MHIGIVGRHPDLEKGFNGVMSLIWARGLSKLGCRTTLYLPVSGVHSPDELLLKSGKTSLDDLERFGDDFSVKTISGAKDLDNDLSVVIWQSYRPQEDWLRADIRRAGVLVAKNPPRLFSGIPEKDAQKAKGLASQYDLIAASLKSDLLEGQAFPELSEKLTYVARGFDTSHLVPNKGAGPIIGFDKAVKAQSQGQRPIDHIVASGQAVRSRFPASRYFSLRDKVEELASERIPLLGYPQFYEQFVNRLWLYLPVDFDYSVHFKGKVYDRTGTHRYVGLYENQVVETQIAGGLVVCRRNDIPDELIMEPRYSYVDDYQNIEALVELLVDNIEHFEARSAIVRQRALERHNFLNTTRAMYEELSKVA